MEITLGSASTTESCESMAGAPCGYVIFGASGDLSHRKFIPAVFSLVKAKKVSDAFLKRMAGLGLSNRQNMFDGHLK